VDWLSFFTSSPTADGIANGFFPMFGSIISPMSFAGKDLPSAELVVTRSSSIPPDLPLHCSLCSPYAEKSNSLGENIASTKSGLIARLC
jgi:hypothetical protein